MLIKMDYNELLNKVSKALHSSKSRYVKEWGNSIAVGFEILNSYLRRIAQRAIETQDAALLEDLANLGLVTEQRTGRTKNERLGRKRKLDL